MSRLAVVLFAALGLVVAAGAAWAADPPALTKEQIETIVRDYIKAHPEVVVEALQNMETQRREAARQQARQNIVARRDELLKDAGSPVAGNPSGDVTIVEFFDYACPHCKNAEPTVKQLLQDDTNVRFVYKELPILGESSVTASRAALASRAQDKYLPFHNALMALKEQLTDAAIFRVAREVGLDVDRLRKDMSAPAIDEAIKKNYDLAQALAITGTPAFVIGEDVAPGAVPLPRLKQMIARARQR
jgi:protein-disulfide isomerase